MDYVDTEFMMGSVGGPQILIFLISMFLSLVPLVVAVWVLITLQRLRVGQEAIRTLDAIERILHKT